jgi:coenzyme F420-reducing hydrogenase delta subunit
MSCGAGPVVLSDKCAACLTCLRVCPFDVPVVTDVAEMKSCLCQGCGICAAECPAKAIVMAGFPADELRGETARALSEMAPGGCRIVVYACGHHASASLWGGGTNGRPACSREIYLPSLSRLSALDLVSALGLGADGVLAVECRSGTCRYPTVGERLRRRVAQARELVLEIGMIPDRIALVEGAAGDPEATLAAISAMRDTVARLGLSRFGERA